MTVAIDVESRSIRSLSPDHRRASAATRARRSRRGRSEPRHTPRADPRGERKRFESRRNQSAALICSAMHWTAQAPPRAGCMWRIRAPRRASSRRLVSTICSLLIRARKQPTQRTSPKRTKPARASLLAVDDPAHLAMASTAATAHDTTIPIVVDVDASYRPGGLTHIGVLRSPLHDALAVADVVERTCTPILGSASADCSLMRHTSLDCPTQRAARYAH